MQRGENLYIISFMKIKEFLKKEVVLIVSFVLAIGSMFFVAPSQQYLGYIDFRTLGLLLSLMSVMAGLNALGVFKAIAQGLLKRVKKSYQLYMVLVLLCFLSSMIITNDVALITFVPFTIVTLKMANQNNRLIYMVVMETIAANLGSMLTPIGNPQNLFLFSYFSMSGGDFLKTILPYSALSLALLLIGALFSGKDELEVNIEKTGINSKWLVVMYGALFVLALLSVFRVLPYEILVAIVLVALLIFDRKCIAKIDYSLLLTFVFLFIFIGNLGNIEAISNWLMSIVEGNEVIVGILSSQVFSNVPACVLLSGFTTNANALLIGVNLGGLGTLIASMASLISYKFIQKENVSTGKYLLVFTALNLLFLALNIILWVII